jgi:chemotaxis protein MotB
MTTDNLRYQPALNAGLEPSGPRPRPTRRLKVRQTVLLTVIFLILATTFGCVKKSTYQAQVDEAARLAETVRSLEAERDALQERVDKLVARNDGLNRDLTEALARNSGLQQDLLRARADLDRLEKVLSARSEEAGKAMAEMRQTIDRLEEENRDLARQVEEERLARQQRIEELKGTYDELVDKMEAEIQRGEITISELQGKLTVNMVEEILFDSGRADIKPAGLKVLGRVGDILKDVADKEIRVEGHTDNVPISSRLREKFPSNWELSSARANSVVHYLQETVGIEGERLSACGFSQYRPIADNDTAEGRARNRRIQIVLVPMEGKVVEPLE